eukprot:365720-Chlamydomonas_euryale.AAC.10
MLCSRPGTLKVEEGGTGRNGGGGALSSALERPQHGPPLPSTPTHHLWVGGVPVPKLPGRMHESSCAPWPRRSSPPTL